MINHHNINTTEVAHFEAMASDWWNENGQCRPLHDLNPIRLHFITQHCTVEGKQILDIGCGGGILTESLCAKGAIVTGIDAAATLIETAKEHGRHTSIHYEHSTAESYATQHPAQFDIITCMELLEHVPDPQSLISAITLLLKPEGHVFLSTLNRTPKAYAFAILGAEYLLGLLPKGTHTYGQFIRPSELNHGLQQAGMVIKHIQGMHYNPFTKKARLQADVSVNYLAHACVI